MSGQNPYRPIIAALLGSLITGAGHLYLRRWLRAAGWLAVAYVVTTLFVPDATLTAMLNGEPVDLLSVLPMLVVAAASALDAYRVALEAESPGSAEGEVDTDPVTGGRAVECPACGKPFDPDLGFCHWCTTEVAPPAEEAETDGDTDDRLGARVE